MANVFSHPYQLGESISNLRVVRWYFSFYSNFKRNYSKQTVENLARRRVLRHQTPSFAASGLVLHYFPITHKKGARLICVKTARYPYDPSIGLLVLVAYFTIMFSVILKRARTSKKCILLMAAYNSQHALSAHQRNDR